MSTLIEVPLWAFLILIVVSWPGFSYLGNFFGRNILGPILLYGYLFFIGQKIYSIDRHGNRTYTRVRWFRSIHIFHILERIRKGIKNERS